MKTHKTIDQKIEDAHQKMLKAGGVNREAARKFQRAIRKYNELRDEKDAMEKAQ